MSKKTKKQARKSPAQAIKSTEPATPTYSFAPSPMAAGRTSDSEFKPDYSATIKDLKRIGILAGSFIAILVILSFFLR